MLLNGFKYLPKFSLRHFLYISTNCCQARGFVSQLALGTAIRDLPWFLGVQLAQDFFAKVMKMNA